MLPQCISVRRPGLCAKTDGSAAGKWQSNMPFPNMHTTDLGQQDDVSKDDHYCGHSDEVCWLWIMYEPKAALNSKGLGVQC